MIFWHSWLSSGKRNMADLVTNKLKSYDELNAQFNLEGKTDSQRHLQISSSLGSVVKQFHDEDNIVQKLFVFPINKQSASTFYKLSANAIYSNCDNLRLVWQRDLKMNNDKDSRVNIIYRAGCVTREARGKFTHYKILHRYCFTPVHLHIMCLLENSLCWKCESHEGTFIHAMWVCPLVFPFWREIIKTIQEWLSTPVPVSAQLHLLGNRSVLLQISKPAFDLVPDWFYFCCQICFTTGRAGILFHKSNIRSLEAHSETIFKCLLLLPSHLYGTK